jgi:ABC-2 type transport system permease protein
MSAFLETNLYRIFRFNPCVTMNELRMRMRGARPFLVLLFYALVAAAAVLLALIPMIVHRQLMYGVERFEVGRVTFSVLAHTQLTLILLILPAYSAGAITMEREKRTLEMLRVTLVTPTDVVSGKLLVIFAFSLVLLLSSLPVAAWCMLFGGIAPDELFYAYTHLFVVAVFVSALGIFFSSFLSRSMAAIVLTYGALIVLSVLSGVITGIVTMILAISGTGRGAFGPLGALVILLILGLASGYVVFVILRWLLARLLPPSARRPVIIVGILAALAWLVFLLHPSLPAQHAVRAASVTWLMILNPYVSLAGILSSDFAGVLTSGSPGGPGPASIHVLIWSISGVVLLALAAALWALSVRIFRSRA